MYYRLLYLIMGLYIVSCEANPIQRDISGQEHGATEQARDVWNAVVNHDLQQVKDLLSDENINTYHPDDGKNTLLLKALWENEADIADYLIQQGASPYGQNILGITPLFIAINKGHSDISKVLITYGANVNIKGPYGITPLLYACLQGDQEVARLLIEHGAFVDDADQSGNTPLIWASHYAHSGIIEKLLEYGACTETLHNENSTPLLSTSRMYMYTSYLENLSSYQLSEPEFQCVQQAFGKDPLKIIKLLIAYGANVDAVGGEEGETPLISAISPHCEDLVRLLLESGADVNKRDNNSQTPLCKACKFGHREIVRTLIMFGADVNAKSEENNVTPLFIASGRGYEDIVRLLIEHGASVDEPGGGDGQTSLIAASQQGKNAIVHLLLENCARVDGESNIILGPHHMGHEVCRYLINTVVPAIHSAQVDLFEQQPDDKKEGYLRIALGRGCFQMAQNIAHQIQDQHYRARGVLAFLQSPLKGTQWLRGFVQSRNIGMQDLLQALSSRIQDRSADTSLIRNFVRAYRNGMRGIFSQPATKDALAEYHASCRGHLVHDMAWRGIIDGLDDMLFLYLRSSAPIESYDQHGYRITLRDTLQQAHGIRGFFNCLFTNAYEKALQRYRMFQSMYRQLGDRALLRCGNTVLGKRKR